MAVPVGRRLVRTGTYGDHPTPLRADASPIQVAAVPTETLCFAANTSVWIPVISR
jgi:hypothetical protein